MPTKRAKLEHANRIRHLAGTHTKLSSSENCIKGINVRLKLSTGSIDAKKKYTYKKGKRSKELIMCDASSEADFIRKIFSKLSYSRY